MENSNEEKRVESKKISVNTVVLILALCLTVIAIVLIVMLYNKLDEIDRMSDILEKYIASDNITSKEDETKKDNITTKSEDTTTNQEETTEKEEITTNQEETAKKEEATTKKEEITTNQEETTVKQEETTTTEIDSSGISPLKVQGTKIVDASGKVIQLNGISTHGLSWFPDYVNKESFKQIHDEWDANVIRLAMYTSEYNGYCAGGNKEELKKLIHKGVELATAEGMYVIIDWHILSDSNPNQNKAEAIAFFSEMSKKYSSYTNIIYEICNEPNGSCTWSGDVKPYALEVIKAIRENDDDALIIVGTPTWSQDVDIAANDPIKGYNNIVYALHFYAATHKEWIQQKLENAVKKGLPVIVSEFSICDASGSGSNDISSANKWMEILDKYDIGFVGWNLSNKNETSAIILNWCNKLSDWEEWEISESGKWLINQLKNHK